MLYEACPKLDVLYSVFMRTELRRFSSARYLMADSSPQKKFNIGCGRQIVISWPPGLSDAECLGLDLAQFRYEQNLPLSAFGYGAASATYKAANFAQKLMLESGGGAAFDKMRNEVMSYTSDGGVDQVVPDSGLPLATGANLNSWFTLMEQVKRGDMMPTSGDATQMFLLPQSITMPDLLHIIFDQGLKDAVTNCAEWEQLEKYTRDFCILDAHWAEDEVLRIMFKIKAWQRVRYEMLRKNCIVEMGAREFISSSLMSCFTFLETGFRFGYHGSRAER